MEFGFEYATYIIVICILVTAVSSDTDVCEKVDSCSCRFTDGTVLNLTSLSSNNGSAAFQTKAIHSVLASTYYFNPCTSFNEGCREADIAVCQRNPVINDHNSCGRQSTARFVNRDGHNSSDIFLLYTGGPLHRSSYIKLVCTQDTESTFTFLNEAPVVTYNFELASPCACPGIESCLGIYASSTVTPPPTTIATATPIPVTCEEKDGCTCEMSDGSGVINLRSLSKPENPLDYLAGNVRYHYNPCTGFTLPIQSQSNACIDVSLCEVEYSNGHVSETRVLGEPDTARFSTKEDGTVVLHYHSSHHRKADVHLICDRSVREEPVFRYLHDHNGRSIFSLRSVCACPGECIGPARTCVLTDSCSCAYSDGSGTVNLHHLNNPFAPLKTTVHIPDERQAYEYYYNPCSGVRFDCLVLINVTDNGKFTLQDGHCFNVSACQRILNEKNVVIEENSLGQMETQGFTTDQNGNLQLDYNGGLNGREFALILICDPQADVPVFEFSNEEPAKHYIFTLRSKCACAGLCT